MFLSSVKRPGPTGILRSSTGIRSRYCLFTATAHKHTENASVTQNNGTTAASSGGKIGSNRFGSPNLFESIHTAES